MLFFLFSNDSQLTLTIKMSIKKTSQKQQQQQQPQSWKYYANNMFFFINKITCTLRHARAFIAEQQGMKKLNKNAANYAIASIARIHMSTLTRPASE